jgi:hypothetical protein
MEFKIWRLKYFQGPKTLKISKKFISFFKFLIFFAIKIFFHPTFPENRARKIILLNRKRNSIPTRKMWFHIDLWVKNLSALKTSTHSNCFGDVNINICYRIYGNKRERKYFLLTNNSEKIGVASLEQIFGSVIS